MSKRVTIMVDEDIDAKLRKRQASIIAKKQCSYSYSRVINELLRKAL